MSATGTKVKANVKKTRKRRVSNNVNTTLSLAQTNNCFWCSSKHNIQFQPLIGNLQSSKSYKIPTCTRCRKLRSSSAPSLWIAMCKQEGLSIDKVALVEMLHKQKNICKTPEDLQIIENELVLVDKNKFILSKGRHMMRQIVSRYGAKCVWCGKKLHRLHPEMTIEHVIPKQDGGVNKISNYAPACYECNNQRQHTNLQHWINNRSNLGFEPDIEILQKVLFQLVCQYGDNHSIGKKAKAQLEQLQAKYGNWLDSKYSQKTLEDYQPISFEKSCQLPGNDNQILIFKLCVNQKTLRLKIANTPHQLDVSFNSWMRMIRFLRSQQKSYRYTQDNYRLSFNRLAEYIVIKIKYKNSLIFERKLRYNHPHRDALQKWLDRGKARTYKHKTQLAKAS